MKRTAEKPTKCIVQGNENFEQHDMCKKTSKFGKLNFRYIVEA